MDIAIDSAMFHLQHSDHMREEPHYKAASLAAKLADTCVSASFLPQVWQTYYERFQGVLLAQSRSLPAV